MNYSVVADRFMRDLIQDFLGGTDLNRVRAQFGGRLVALLREAQKDAETDARMRSGPSVVLNAAGNPAKLPVCRVCGAQIDHLHERWCLLLSRPHCAVVKLLQTVMIKPALPSVMGKGK